MRAGPVTLRPRIAPGVPPPHGVTGPPRSVADLSGLFSEDRNSLQITQIYLKDAATSRTGEKYFWTVVTERGVPIVGR